MDALLKGDAVTLIHNLLTTSEEKQVALKQAYKVWKCELSQNSIVLKAWTEMIAVA